MKELEINYGSRELLIQENIHLSCASTRQFLQHVRDRRARVEYNTRSLSYDISFDFPAIVTAIQKMKDGGLSRTQAFRRTMALYRESNGKVPGNTQTMENEFRMLNCLCSLRTSG